MRGWVGERVRGWVKKWVGERVSRSLSGKVEEDKDNDTRREGWRG